MIQHVDTHKVMKEKVMKEIHIAMKPVLPLLPNFVYDIKQALWEEIDIKICDTISESTYKNIFKNGFISRYLAPSNLSKCS